MSRKIKVLIQRLVLQGKAASWEKTRYKTREYQFNTTRIKKTSTHRQPPPQKNVKNSHCFTGSSLHSLFALFKTNILIFKTSLVSTRPPAPCPRTTSWPLDVLPLDEPGFGSCQTNSLGSAGIPTRGHKAGESGLCLHPGADLGWKLGICGAAHGVFIPAISKVGFDAAASSAQGGDDANTPGKLSEVTWGCAMLSSAQKGFF